MLEKMTFIRLAISKIFLRFLGMVIKKHYAHYDVTHSANII